MKRFLSLRRLSLAFATALLLTTFAHAQSVTTTTTSAGTISELSPDTIVVRTETDAAPLRYNFTTTTQYVDETGAPVARELVKSGVPVTVHYLREGDRMIANRVVVRKTTTTTTAPLQPAPTVIERTTTVTPPPVVVERPVVVEKPVIIEKKVPVVVERPVVVEKRVNPTPALVEERKTTTTTTTTDRK